MQSPGCFLFARRALGTRTRKCPNSSSSVLRVVRGAPGRKAAPGCLGQEAEKCQRPVSTGDIASGPSAGAVWTIEFTEFYALHRVSDYCIYSGKSSLLLLRWPFSLLLPDRPGVAGDFLCYFMCQPQGFFHQTGGGRESVGRGTRLLNFPGIFPIHGVR